MEKRAFPLIEEMLLKEAVLSRTYLQRKLKVSWKEADRLIRKFVDEKIHLHKYKKYEKFRKNTCAMHVFHRKIVKGKYKHPMIVVIGGTKGGGGKSTIAINLVTILCSLNKAVLFIDGDEQKSSISWSQDRAKLGIETPWSYQEMYGRNIREMVLQRSKGYDEVIVDVGGRDTTTQRAILTIADFYLIPIKPGPLDLRALDYIKTMLMDVLPANPKLPVCAVLNQADHWGGNNELASNVLQQANFIKPLKTIIRNRVSIRNSLWDGLGVIEMKPKDKKAVDEMMNLYKEIYEECLYGKKEERI